MKNIRIHIVTFILKVMFPKKLLKAQAIVILPIESVTKLEHSRGRASVNFSAVQSIKVNLPSRPTPPILFAEFHTPTHFNCNCKY